MKHVYGLCVAIGLLLTIGFAGGSDCGTLSLGQAAWYSVGSMLVAIVGFVGLKGLEEAEK